MATPPRPLLVGRRWELASMADTDGRYTASRGRSMTMAPRLCFVPSARDLRSELPCSRRERCQPLDLQIGARAEQIDPRRREDGEIDLVTAPVGTAAVVVGASVLASEFPRPEEHTGVVAHVRVGCECSDRASDEERRLRLQEIRVLLPCVTPVVFGDAEVLQHRFRTQETGRDR